MKTIDILEWVSGWAWPVLTGVAILIALGITRILSWDKKDLSNEQSASKIFGEHCDCQCE